MGKRDRLFNMLTIVMLGLTVLTLACYLIIAINPHIPLNPFPPGTQVALLVLPSATPTPEGQNAPPTWTPTATPTITPTPPPTFTPTTTSTPEPTGTPKPTKTPTPRVTRASYPFTAELTYETPYYGCNWAGVAGLVQDLDGNPLTGYVIRVSGGGLDKAIEAGEYQMYGDSGWEQFFNNYPIDVEGEYRVQLHDKNPPHGPVSDVIMLDFQGFCSKSMAFVVFTQNH